MRRFGGRVRNPYPWVLPPLAVGPPPEHVARWFGSQGFGLTYVNDEGNPDPATDIPRLIGQTLEFDGANDFVRVGFTVAQSGISGFPFTMMAWFRPANITQTSTLVSFGLDDTEYVEIGMTTSSPSIRRSGTSASTSLRPLVASTWAHLAVAFTSATDAKIYVDGAYLETLVTTSHAWDTYEQFRIGAGQPSFGFEDRHFAGRIHDVRLYDREMTAAEILNIYRSTRRPGQNMGSYFYTADLVAHYGCTINSSSGSVKDHSVNLFHAIPEGGLQESTISDLPACFENELGYSLVAGERMPRSSYDAGLDVTAGALQYTGPLARQAKLIQSPCASFDGVNDYFDTNFSPGATATQGTIMVHVKMNDIIGDQCIFGSLLNSPPTRLYISNNAGKFGGGVGVYYWASVKDTIVRTTTEWYHVALSFSPSSHKLFVNGELRYSGGANTGAADHTFFIGGMHFNAVPLEYAANCQVSDARYYDSQLSDIDIATLADGGFIATEPTRQWPLAERSGLNSWNVSSVGTAMVANGTTSGELWANTQDEYHYNMIYGFTDVSGVRVPALRSGASDAQGNTISNPAGIWHNAAETKVNFVPVDAPWKHHAGRRGAASFTTTGHTPINVISTITGFTSSMSLLVRVKDIPTDNYYYMFGASAGSSANQFLFGIDSTGQVIGYINTDQLELSNPGYYDTIAGDYHDLLVTISGTTANLYIDGIGSATNPSTGGAGTFDASAWTRAYLACHENGTANKFKGKMARFTLYPSVIDYADRDTAANILDIRFDWNRIEDTQGRIPSVMYDGTIITPDTITMPTAYTFGDTLPVSMSKTVASGVKEHLFHWAGANDADNYDE